MNTEPGRPRRSEGVLIERVIETLKRSERLNPRQRSSLVRAGRRPPVDRGGARTTGTQSTEGRP